MGEGSDQIDLNTASLDALTQLPGIGPALAQRIVAARPFAGAGDLVRVQGINTVKLERLLPKVTVYTSTAEPAADSDDALLQDADVAPGMIETEREGMADIPETTAEMPETGADAAAVGAPETIRLSIPELFKAEGPVETEAAKEIEPSGEADADAQTSETEGTEADDSEAGTFSADVSSADTSEADISALEAPEDLSTGDWERAWEMESSPEVEEPSAAVAPETERPLPAPEAQRPAVTRARLRWTALLSILAATLLATLLTLGIVSFINGGQLQFVTPTQFGRLSARAQGIEAQAGTLAQDIESLRMRLDNLDTLSERIDDTEQVTQRMQAELAAATGEVADMAQIVSDLEGQASDLKTQVADLETLAADLSKQAEDVDARVGTLETESSRAQAFLEGLSDLLNTIFSPEEGTP